MNSARTNFISMSLEIEWIKDNNDDDDNDDDGGREGDIKKAKRNK